MQTTRAFLDHIEGLILMPGDEVYYRNLLGAPAPQVGEIIERHRHCQMTGHGGLREQAQPRPPIRHRVIFEIAAARYLDDPPIGKVLKRERRAQDTTELLCFEALISGANPASKAGDHSCARETSEETHP